MSAEHSAGAVPRFPVSRRRRRNCRSAGNRRRTALPHQRLRTRCPSPGKSRRECHGVPLRSLPHRADPSQIASQLRAARVSSSASLAPAVHHATAPPGRGAAASNRSNLISAVCGPPLLASPRALGSPDQPGAHRVDPHSPRPHPDRTAPEKPSQRLNR